MQDGPWHEHGWPAHWSAPAQHPGRRGRLVPPALAAGRAHLRDALHAILQHLGRPLGVLHVQRHKVDLAGSGVGCRAWTGWSRARLPLGLATPAAAWPTPPWHRPTLLPHTPAHGRPAPAHTPAAAARGTPRTSLQDAGTQVSDSNAKRGHVAVPSQKSHQLHTYCALCIHLTCIKLQHSWPAAQQVRPGSAAMAGPTDSSKMPAKCQLQQSSLRIFPMLSKACASPHLTRIAASSETAQHQPPTPSARTVHSAAPGQAAQSLPRALQRRALPWSAELPGRAPLPLPRRRRPAGHCRCCCWAAPPVVLPQELERRAWEAPR